MLAAMGRTQMAPDEDAVQPKDLLMPAVAATVTLYLGLNSGGFFPGTQAFASLLLAAVLAFLVIATPTRNALVPQAAMAGAALLGLLVAWTLLSAAWSGSWARTVLEANRIVLYVLCLLTFAAALPRDGRGLRLLIGAITGSLVVICAVGLSTRLMPDLLDAPPDFLPDRLSYPVTYWNGLGVIAAIAAVGSLHVSSDWLAPRIVRVLGAMALPITLVTLYFTFSRGSIVAFGFGALFYLVVIHSRGCVLALVAAVPSCYFPVRAAVESDALSEGLIADPAFAADGSSLLSLLIWMVVLAGLLRLGLTFLDSRRDRQAEDPRLAANQPLQIAVVAGVVVLMATALAVGPGQKLFDSFDSGTGAEPDDPRERLSQIGSQGRVEHWKVAFKDFRARPITGSGAGTFESTWERQREDTVDVQDAHSLYLEMLSELGIVGFGLLAGSLAIMWLAIVVRQRSPDRAPSAAVLTILSIWIVHAAVDWDWELAAVTAPVMMLIGGALAEGPLNPSRGLGPVPARWMPALRAAVVVPCIAIGALAAFFTESQSATSAAADALRVGNCDLAEDRAQQAISETSFRPEPYEVVAYCALGEDRAVGLMRETIRRDPNNWEGQYGLALALARAGRDPTRAIRAATELNPNEPLVRALPRLTDVDSASDRATLAAFFPVPDRLIQN